MRTARVVVLPYDKAWKSAFEEIKSEIENAIGDLTVGIEHVGSTSVEGLSAKPCIDIDVIIKDYSVFDAVVEKLNSIGYIHEGDLGIKDREAFKYSDKPHLQKHHLYVCPQYSEELHRHIAFRDYLRANPEAAGKYGKVKEEAARLFPDDIDKYIEYKSPCIEEMYKLCGLK
ncbi:MAG: GrpB family protein [Clostridia bacterium]|nr:GrpB family protein [Clostridia bacterium]